MLYIRDDDWRTSYTEAGSIIIPMAARYEWFKDRNKPINQRWEMIPNNLHWLMNTYMGKFKLDECVEAMGAIGALSSTYGQAKNVSASFSTTYITQDAKPIKEYADKVADKPTIISLTVANSALDFDRKYVAGPNELVTEQDKAIVGAVTRGLTKAIEDRKNNNPNIFITPLFRNNIYNPIDDSKLNVNWDMPNYVNSMIMSLAKYDLDKFNIHVFIRTQPRLSNAN